MVFTTNIETNSANFNINFEPACESVLLINLDTDTTIYSKNAQKTMFPASLTKIMTFIVTVENTQDIMNTNVTVKKSLLNKLLGTGSSLSGIKANEILSVYQLLHCLMIRSGNDAALVLADLVGEGNIDKFVELMNKKAAEIGCTCTNFVNPHGLHDENHYTTAEDMAKITKYAMNLPHFVEISSQVTSYILGRDRYPLVTTNSLTDPVRGGKYYCKFAKGIKTGSDTLSGKCLVSSASHNGYSYLCVAMGGFSTEQNDAMLDAKALYEWAFKNLELKQVMKKEMPLGETKLKLAWRKDSVQFFPAKDCSVILPKGVAASSVNVKINKIDSVKAPIVPGQALGSATLSYANSDLASIDLVAADNIGRNNILYAIDLVKNVTKSILFKITIVTLLILAIFYTTYMLKINKNKRRRRKVHKFKRYKY